MVSRGYFNNKKFLADFKIYSETECPRRKNFYREKCFTQIVKIVENVPLMKQFNTYTEVEISDMQFYAYEILSGKLDKFSIEKTTNPFGYFTKVTINAFKRVEGNLGRYRNRNIAFGRIENIGDFT